MRKGASRIGVCAREAGAAHRVRRAFDSAPIGENNCGRPPRTRIHSRRGLVVINVSMLLRGASNDTSPGGEARKNGRSARINDRGGCGYSTMCAIEILRSAAADERRLDMETLAGRGIIATGDCYGMRAVC